MAAPIILAPGETSVSAKRNAPFLFLITFVAAMGGLLFGYDWVVIGGAAKFYEAFFHLRDTAATLAPDASSWDKFLAGALSPTGWAQSCALLGCLAGALASGWISDRFGRKPALIFAALNFLVTSVGIGAADTFSAFVIWRILGGVSIGLASAVSPMYISEISPPDIRGLLVAINQLAIVIGVLAAQIVNWLIARPETVEMKTLAARAATLTGSEAEAARAAYETLLAASWNATHGWRWMFVACAVPSLAFLLGSLRIPESPRWLAKTGRRDRARAVLARIGGDDYADASEAAIEASSGAAETGVAPLREMFRKPLFGILLTGCLLAVFQQWCGINVIFNYAGEIFTQAGYNMDDTLTSIMATGSVNLLFTFVALGAVDRLGRKPLMIFGYVGLAVLYVALGACYWAKAGGAAVPPAIFLGLVLAAIGVYAMSLAPVTWVLIAEIFPTRIRGRAVSVAVGCLWLACFALTYSFPILNARLGAAATFGIYAAVCAVAAAMILRRLPETKGRSLEEIEKSLAGSAAENR